MDKVFILQRFIPKYRLGVFKRIAPSNQDRIQMLIGENIEGLKAKNHSDLHGVNYRMLNSKKYEFLGKLLVNHIGLFRTLVKERPSVVICEAESHFLGYLKAIAYKLLFLGKPKLILWCFFVLPGKELGFFDRYMKPVFRSFFSGFISYSSLGKNFLVSHNVKKPIVVATNVCDTDYYDSLLEYDNRTSIECKDIYNLAGKFVVSFVGTIDEVKKPDFIIKMANQSAQLESLVYLIVGDGPYLSELKNMVKELGLKNVVFTGKVQDIVSVMKATNVLMIPGRGGIVISEAMCCSKPVIVHEADGTELDLIVNGQSGFIVDDLNTENIINKINILMENQEEYIKMCNWSLKFSKIYNTKNMADKVIEIIEKV
ncbi:glycosyltransferase [Vibrio metoecus]|uniref:glycosyltransferase n=1 Tax=Vibrio metoecus TaxID=1481663 RepID=UPI0012AE81DE|nr:glycosyltransferase [Vibrio metoecus]